MKLVLQDIKCITLLSSPSPIFEKRKREREGSSGKLSYYTSQKVKDKLRAVRSSISLLEILEMRHLATVLVQVLSVRIF